MDDINIMHTQLLQSQAENQKLKAQLEGLISLVRKAWSGDHSAAIDVAIIVGVSPPTLEISSTMNELVAVPKPPAVNNWLKLTIGLINKDYKERQLMIKARQLMYLHHREAYIDEQMEGNKYPDRPKLGEVARRTNSLCDIIGNENEKREKLKLDLERNERRGDSTCFNTKGRPGSGKKMVFKDFKDKQNMKIADETKLDDCLVVRPRNKRHSQEQSLGTSKSRPKSAGCAMNNNKNERPNRTTKKRPESARTLPTTTTTRRKAPARPTVSHGHSEGRIKHELDETEKDITLTTHLLQERLGIDRKGMV